MVLDGATWVWRIRLWCAAVLAGRQLTVRNVEEWLCLVKYGQERTDRQQQEIIRRLERIEEAVGVDRKGEGTR